MKCSSNIQSAQETNINKCPDRILEVKLPAHSGNYDRN